jgi:hypothetical protein
MIVNGEAAMNHDPKTPYEKPAIVNSESLETRAVVCTKSNSACSNITN